MVCVKLEKNLISIYMNGNDFSTFYIEYEGIINARNTAPKTITACSAATEIANPARDLGIRRSPPHTVQCVQFRDKKNHCLVVTVAGVLAVGRENTGGGGTPGKRI